MRSFWSSRSCCSSARGRQSHALQERFGPEYAHAVREYGDDASAEKELAARAQRVEQLRIRPLASEQSARYVEDWRSTQSRFVDDPEGAISDADTLVAEVMQARGYPMGDFEQQAADISVDHPAVVEHTGSTCYRRPFGKRRSDN